MKKLLIANSVLFVLLIYGFRHTAFAWDQKGTHKELSDYAAEHSILSSTGGDYLSNIGLEGGLTYTLLWNETHTVKEWIKEGAELEDTQAILFPIGVTRSFNHFLNPLKDWDKGGLDDWVATAHYTGESSILWAQDGATQAEIVEGDWSWKTVRDYFYQALTSSSSSTRNEYFAKTFRGIGQQLHLLQDAAVPDHVRNSAHPVSALIDTNWFNGSYYFEPYAKKHRQAVIDLASSPQDPSVALDVSYDNLAPITQLFDTKQYKLGLTPSTSLAQGLAEYANANFFSEDTIFASERFAPDDPHYFPYPNRASTDLQSFIDGTKPEETITTDDGKQIQGIWISKTGDGENIAHLARASATSLELYRDYGKSEGFYKSFYRDDMTHKDYIEKLVPRAVGYSTALINYFFRGAIGIVEDSGGGYAIQNNSAEDMSGAFEIWYDTSSYARTLLWSGNLDLKSGASQAVSFNMPTDMMDQCKFIVVFNKGSLGAEDGAVAAGLADLSKTGKCVCGAAVETWKSENIFSRASNETCGMLPVEPLSTGDSWGSDFYCFDIDYKVTSWSCGSSVKDGKTYFNISYNPPYGSNVYDSVAADGTSCSELYSNVLQQEGTYIHYSYIQPGIERVYFACDPTEGRKEYIYPIRHSGTIQKNDTYNCAYMQNLAGEFTATRTLKVEFPDRDGCRWDYEARSLVDTVETETGYEMNTNYLKSKITGYKDAWDQPMKYWTWTVAGISYPPDGGDSCKSPVTYEWATSIEDVIESSAEKYICKNGVVSKAR